MIASNANAPRHYPLNEVIGTLPTPQALENVLESLRSRWVAPDDLRLLCGPRGAEVLDKDGSSHGLAERVRRFMQHFGDEYRQLVRFDADLREGRLLLAVPTHALSKEETADLFRQHGGGKVTFFGRLALEDL